MITPKFIEELVEAGISVTLQKGNKFRLEGFYKSGEVTIEQREGGWVACARYNEVTGIDTLQDLVNLNYKWWQYSKDRYEGWQQPESLWAPLMVKFGLVQEKTIPAQTVYE